MGLTFGGVIYSDDQTFELPNDKSGTLALTSDINGGAKVYRALLTQSGTGAPVATVLENSLGTVAYSYNNIGQFIGTLPEAFPVNKTYLRISDSVASIDSNYQSVINRSDNNSFVITTTIDLVENNGVLFNTPIEILVYP